MTDPGTKVYVRWYGKVLEGEVVDGGGFAGMTPVRIPLDGHHPVALFAPGHVYQTESEAGSLAQTKPVVKEILKEVQEYIADVYINDKLDRFKKSHWDEARNHLRIDALDEFYQLWRQTHTHQPDNNRYIVGVDPGAPAGDVRVVLPLKPPPPPVHHKQRPKDVIRKNIVQLSLF
jgi:hypothetical protein